MGTRADFYVGTTTEAEWLGSIGFDGYPDGVPMGVLTATAEGDFRANVADFLDREDGTLPEMGWPWPWDDSGTTDYAYMLDSDHGEVVVIAFGQPVAVDLETWEETGRPDVTFGFPDMADRKAATYGQRSGAIFLSVSENVNGGAQ